MTPPPKQTSSSTQVRRIKVQAHQGQSDFLRLHAQKGAVPRGGRTRALAPNEKQVVGQSGIHH